ncbi:MAG: integrase family protein [Chitinophagaceae bacterium]|nr:integrase family protein [Chitinophagaceae bacterium]
MKVKDLFEDYLDYRFKEGNCLKTIKEITRFLAQPIYQAVGEIELDDLKLIHSANVKDAGTKYGIYGSQRAIVYFKQLLEYAHRAGYKIPFNYHDIKIPKVPDKRVEYLSLDEIDQIRKCFPVGTAAGLRSRALMEFLLDTGLRIGEAIALNREDVNFETREIQVLNIKTKEWGSVFINDNVSVEWLKLYLNSRKDDNPALFVSGRNRMLSVSSRNYIRQATKHLKFSKRICHHVFRRTLGTTLAQEGVDLKTVKDILRHKSERTTLRYYIGSDKERSREKHKEITGKMFSSFI